MTNYKSQIIINKQIANYKFWFNQVLTNEFWSFLFFVNWNFTELLKLQTEVELD